MSRLPEPHPELLDEVRKLPLRQRQAIALRYFADLPEAEVAEIMHISTGTASATLSVARTRLRQRLRRRGIASRTAFPSEGYA